MSHLYLFKMNNYFITYNSGKTVTITDITADHAKNTLKRVIPNVTVINSCIKLKQKSDVNICKSLNDNGNNNAKRNNDRNVRRKNSKL